MKSVKNYAAAVLIVVGAVAAAKAQQSEMSFFVTSVNPGKGAELGGLEGADAYCQKLASEAGASAKTWRAYLSQSATGAMQAVNARDRIGKGPWKNAKGEVIAKDVDDLHKDPNINKQTALDEKGNPVKGRGDSPNEHDILTGTQPDGTAFAAGDKDMTCGNWTKGGEGSAIVGHHDRMGLDESAPAKSWNSSHGTSGCGMQALRSTGGAGLFYCFATN
ncbi:MAG: hypothetical protein IT539_00685 [Bradyrhizobiaceae bacterium]|nr:hypothetical protein [Bradyrhizobiaceae bacterium]